MMPGYIPTATDPRKPTAAATTRRCKSRGEAERTLLEHGLDGADVTELLDLAELEGGAQTARARVTFDGAAWTADLFGPKPEAT